MELDHPVVRLSRDAQGRPDWAAGPGTGSLSQPIEVQRLRITHGRVLYDDAEHGTRLDAAVTADPDAPDGMGLHVAHRVLKLVASRTNTPARPRVLVLGLAFKENCGDLRNTRVVDIVAELASFGADVDVHDPRVDADEARREHEFSLVDAPQAGAYDAVVLAVPHREFLEAGVDAVRAFGRPDAVIYDVKGALPRDAVHGRL